MEVQKDKEITLGDLLAVLRRRLRIVYVTALLFLTVAAVYCLTATRRYEATAIVQLQKESGDSLGLADLLSGSDDDASSIGSNVDLQTQANILQSETLALKTIEALKLEETADFAGKPGLFTRLLGRDKDSASKQSLESSPARRHSAVSVFEKNLKVKPIGGTRLIEIDYESPDPELAAAVVNRLTRALIDYTFQTRYDATNQTSEWLRTQLGDLRKDSQALQSKVVELERQSGVYALDTADSPGQQQAYSDVLNRLQQVTTALVAAEQSRILKGAIAHAADVGDAELLSGLAGNLTATASMANSLTLIQTLRQQESTAQAALDQAQAKYGPAYSRIDELKGQLTGIQNSIREEIARIRSRADNDFAVARTTEAEVRAQYEAVKAQADKLNDKAIEYAIAKQDAIQSRFLYEDLTKRLKEAGVIASLRSSNVTVVDPGRTPSLPARPNVPLIILGALFGGLIVGAAAALLYHSIDRTVNTIGDLEAAVDEPIMAALPLVDEQTLTENRMILQSAPQSPYSEAVRSARTAILLSKSGQPPQVILVTSALPGEGKSFFSINIAASLATRGKKVLVVDIDLRRGVLARRFNIPAADGLSSALSGMSEGLAVHPVPEMPDLSIVGPGPVPPNPSELLSADVFGRYISQWRKEYDFVVLDSAPVLPVTDSVSVSRVVDATLLLARAGLVRREQVRRSYSLLYQGAGHTLGIVLNGLSGADASYYDYYGYYEAYSSRGDKE